MTIQEHYRACVLWMDNDRRLYERGVAIATVTRKANNMVRRARLVNSYAHDIITTTNLKESAHPFINLEMRSELLPLVVGRINEVFAEWDAEFAPLDNAVAETKS